MKNKIVLLIISLFFGSENLVAEVVTSIGTLEQWKAFVASVNAGDDYSSKTVTLTTSITMETSGFASQTVGTSEHPFTGTFDGGGNTLTYNFTSLTGLQYCAPFRYIKSATIKNLKIAGEMNVTDNNYLAGIVGYVGGTSTTDVSYIDNCTSSMSLTNSASDGDGRIGGIVGYQLANSGLQITNCLVDGTITGRGQAAGVMGYKKSGASLTVSSVFLSSTIVGKVNTFVKSEGGEQTISSCYTTIASPEQGTYVTTANLESGEVAYNLQGNQATQYWGQSNLNKSTAESLPKLTSTAADKVIKISFTNGSAVVYANYNGPYNAVAKKVLSFYSGGAETGNYGPYTTDVTVSRSVSKYILNVSSAGATTLVLPGNVSSLPANVKAYELTYTSGEKVTASEITSIAANKPVLINAPEGQYVLTTDNTGSEITYDTENAHQNGALYGVYTDTYKYVPADSYVLQNGAEGLGFYKVKAEKPIKITSFRAYLTAQAEPAEPESPQAPRLSIVYNNNTTGINSVREQTNNDDAIYTLNGVRVSRPTKGIYIKNGKKYIVK